MLGLVRSLLIELGGAIQSVKERNSSYSPQYDGMWITKKKYGVEEVVWKELKPKERVRHVSVFNIEDDYIITVGFNKRGQSINTVSCRDSREVEMAIDLLEIEYRNMGNVIIQPQEESYE